MARSSTVTSRPYVLASAATSLDGYLDDRSEGRLLVSNDEDFDRVDEVRAGVDAILVGANTIRRDNPKLLVRSARRVRGRTEAGLSEHPMKVTLTSGGDLDPTANFFTAGAGDKLVYAATPVLGQLRERLGARADLWDAGDPPGMRAVLADLAARGVDRLLVEGGATVHTALLAAGLVDELQLVCAPFLLGTQGGPRLFGDAEYPQGLRHPMTLAEVRRIGDLVLLRYLDGADDA